MDGDRSSLKITEHNGFAVSPEKNASLPIKAQGQEWHYFWK